MPGIVFALLAAAAGAATSLQSAANAALSARTGLPAALVLNAGVVLLGALAFHFARGANGTFFPAGTPWSLYVGGFCGFFIIFSLASAFPRIGGVLAIALVVLGQAAAALAIDHFGWLGMPREPVTLARVAGLLLVGGGALLIRA
jgi:transporter family-2 protein